MDVVQMEDSDQTQIWRFSQAAATAKRETYSKKPVNMDTDGNLSPIGTRTATGDLNKQNKRVDMDSRNRLLPPLMDSTRKDEPETSYILQDLTRFDMALFPLFTADSCDCADFAEETGCGESSKIVQLNNSFKQQPVVEERQPLTPKQKQVLEQMFMDCEYDHLLRPFRTWEEKVVMILHVVRLREITDFNPRKGCCLPYRFSKFNIAFFDFDKESEVVHGPMFRDIHPSNDDMLECSFNVMCIKVAESLVRYPIHIYGTILARDHNDYRCVYLFKRGRDDPQVITRKNRMLALTGPYRALGGNSSMYFEFDLKMKVEGAVDEDFSKGLKVLHAFKHTPGRPCTFSLISYLSTLDMMCVPVPSVLEASIGVNFLNGKSTFTGKIFASTSGSYTSNKMVMYDSEVAGTNTELRSDGSVYLSRHIVAVPRGEDLLLYFVVRDSYNKSRRLKFVISQDVDERSCNLGTYRLHVKILWKGVFRQYRVQLKDIGGTKVLW